MSKKPTVLMILDGFGLNDKTEGNAVAQATSVNSEDDRQKPSILKRWGSWPYAIRHWSR